MAAKSIIEERVFYIEQQLRKGLVDWAPIKKVYDKKFNTTGATFNSDLKKARTRHTFYQAKRRQRAEEINLARVATEEDGLYINKVMRLKLLSEMALGEAVVGGELVTVGTPDRIRAIHTMCLIEGDYKVVEGATYVQYTEEELKQIDGSKSSDNVKAFIEG